MNKNKYCLTFLTLISLGTATQEHCAQAALIKTATSARSLLTNGFNAWMAKRDTFNCVGAGLFCADALLYAWYRHQFFKFDDLVHRYGAFDHNDRPTKNFENRSNAERKMCWLRDKLYPISFGWAIASLQPESIFGFVASYLIWQNDRMRD